jgi:hypothetical protein
MKAEMAICLPLPSGAPLSARSSSIIYRLQRKLRNAGGDEAAANCNLAAPLAQIQHSLWGRIVLFGGAPAIIEATRVLFADQKAAGIAWVAHVAAAIFTPMASFPAEKWDRGVAVGITPAYRVAEVIKWQIFDEGFLCGCWQLCAKPGGC